MGKWVHRISDIDAPARRATCLSCGPVDVVRNNANGWRCKIGYDAYRERRRKLRVLPAGYKKSGQCEKCGFRAEHPCQLDVDHKDGDPSNGSPDNIWTICANCHRLKSWHELIRR